MTNRTLRVAHLADTHLGYRAFYKIDPETGRKQRSLDIEDSFSAAIDRILASEVDLVLHAGDVFHHTRPSWPALRCFVREFRRLEAAGIPTVVIAGNHDTPRLRSSGSAFSVLELALQDVHFVTEYDLRAIEFPDLDVEVVAVPHGALTNPDPPLPLIHNGRQILLTHGWVPGVRPTQMGEPGEEELDPMLLDEGFVYVALGHYHLWGPAGFNAWYAGSTERTGWGDEGAKPGFLIVTLGDGAPEVEHVGVPARPMITLEPLSGEERNARDLADLTLDRVRALHEPSAMVRIRFLDTPRLVLREAEELLRREVGDLVWSLQVTSPRNVLENWGRREDEFQTANLLELFDQFVTERTAKTHDQTFVTAFRERGQRAIKEALHHAETALSSEGAAS